MSRDANGGQGPGHFGPLVAVDAAGDESLQRELPTAELNVLLKFLQTLGDLPKIEIGDGSTRGERLAVWKTAVEAQLRTTRRVVMEWWQWTYAGAERYYNHWLKLPLLQRNVLNIIDVMPVKYQTVEDCFIQVFALCLEAERCCGAGADIWWDDQGH